MTPPRRTRSKWLALALLATTQFVDRPRRVDRQRRAALDRARAGLLAGQPLVGRQRLHADLRRLPAARRAPRRPARPPARVHHRPDRLLARLAPRRPRPVRRLADRRARPAGPRRRARLPRRAVDRHEHVRRGRRAQQGARASGARSPAPAAPPACCSAACSPQYARLGVGAVRQRADRPAAPRSWRRGCSPRAATSRERGVRRRRRGHRHRRPVAARLHARRRHNAGWGSTETLVLGRRVARCCWPRSS